MWFIAATVVAMVALGGWALSSMPEPATADRTPRPIPTFSFDGEPERETVAFIGDSFTEGAGSSTTTREYRWSTLVSDELGWVEKNFAVGGTGYVNGGPADAPFHTVVPEVVATEPDIVVVAGGGNDQWSEPAEVEDAAGDLFATLRSELPDAQIIVISPWWHTEPPASMPDLIEAVRSAAEADGATFVDTGQPLQGHREWLSGDGIHPNDEGYAVLADAVLDALRGEGLVD